MSGRIVAELGRPETTEETEDRQARNRALRRSRQTFTNLLACLVVCVGLVVAIILFVPRGQPATQTSIDVHAAARGAALGVPVLVPDVPPTWKSNAAEMRATDQIQAWYAGYVTPANGFVAYTEAPDANVTWLGDTVADAPSVGTRVVGGLLWRVYDQRAKGQDAGNVAYGLATRIGSTYLVVYGTATDAEIQRVATSLAEQAATAHLAGANSAPAAS